MQELLDLLKTALGDNKDVDFDKITKTFQSTIDAEVEKQTSALKEKNSELHGTRKALQEKLNAVPEDFDPEKWAALLDEHKKNENKKMISSEDYDAALKLATSEFSKKLEKQTKENDILMAQLERHVLDSAAMSEIVHAKGNPDLIGLHVRQGLKMATDSKGEFVAKVVDANGNERYSKTNPGEHMTISEYVAEFKANPSFAPAFPAANSGGGAGGSGNGSGGGQPNPFMKGTPAFNVTNQIAMQKKQPELAAEMRRQAEAAQNKA